jgi:DNA-binding transcriptional regulator YhcF (GntR family)
MAFFTVYEVKPSRRIILQAIKELNATGDIYSIPDIAASTGYCTRTIIRALKDLEQKREIKVLRRPGYAGRNQYEVISA